MARNKNGAVVNMVADYEGVAREAIYVNGELFAEESDDRIVGDLWLFLMRKYPVITSATMYGFTEQGIEWFDEQDSYFPKTFSEFPDGALEEVELDVRDK